MKFNSLAAYPPLHWWAWLLYPLALLKCNKRIIQQYKEGCRRFTFGISVTNEGDIIANNGIYDVKADVYDILFRLNYHSRQNRTGSFVFIDGGSVDYYTMDKIAEQSFKYVRII